MFCFVCRRPQDLWWHKLTKLRLYDGTFGPDLYGGLFLSVMESPDGERREAVPLPLAAAVALEKLVLSACVGSHIAQKPHEGVSSVGSGLLSRPDSPDTWWTTTFLNLLEERRQALCMRLQNVAFAPDAFFFWDALHSGDAEAEGCFAPLQYGVALKWLRKFLMSLGLGAEVSSSYATLLSWMNQLLLSPSLRAMQGHHKVDSVTLYGRDDVWRALLLGWRPTTPQHRGGQHPLQEPKVCLPAFEEVGDFPQEGTVTLPMLSVEIASVPSQPPDPVGMPVAEVPLASAFLQNPKCRSSQHARMQVAGRTLRASASRTACGLWSEKFQVLHELPAGARLCKHRACHLALLSA